MIDSEVIPTVARRDTIEKAIARTHNHIASIQAGGQARLAVEWRKNNSSNYSQSIDDYLNAEARRLNAMYSAYGRCA